MKNLKLWFFVIVAIMLAVTPLLVSCAEEEPPAEETIELTLGSAWAPEHPDSLAVEAWIDKVENETNGRVHITPYWGGALLAPPDNLAGLIEGLADIGLANPAYTMEGYDICKAMFGFFYGVKDMDTANRIYTEVRAQFPEIDAEFEDFKPVSYFTCSPYHILCEKPIRTWDDARGLTFKAASLFIPPLQELGAEGTYIPMGETYISLEKHIIDGLFGAYETLKTFNFAEVTKYCTYLNIVAAPQPGYSMNLDTWNSLPSEIQQVFEDNIEFFGSEMHRQFTAADQEGLEFGEELGVEPIYLPSEDVQRFYDLLEVEALKVAAELDAEGIPGTEIFQEVRRLVEEYS